MSLAATAALPVAARRPRLAGWVAARPELLLTPLLFLSIVAAWEAAVRFGLVSRHLLPPPSAIAGALIEGLRSGVFAENAAVTALQAAVGFAIASSAGVLLGGAIAEFNLLRRMLLPYIVALQTMPKIALAPLLVVWFGFGMPSKIAVATVISFFPVLVNTIAGLDHGDAGRLDVLRALGASRWQAFRLARLPGALPYVFTGLSVASVFALTGAIVGEFVGATAGLGVLIVQAQSTMDIPQVFAVIIVLGAMGALAFGAIAALRRRLLFWAPEGTDRSFTA